MPNTEELIKEFYHAFQRHDAEAMVSLYHDDVVFSDPMFKTLKGEQARNMWRMLIERGKGQLEIFFGEVLADEYRGITRWEAVYPYKPTGRIIRNKVKASFEFKDGKIISHHDCFSVTRWFFMAYGIKGFFLSLLPPARIKMRSVLRKELEKFESKNGN